MKIQTCLLMFLILTYGVVHAQTGNFCSQPISDNKIDKYFEVLALKQMALEFGPGKLELSDTQHSEVGPDLMRVESYLKFRKPGRENLSTILVKGWISRCSGTLIIRGNTWLADGTLAVQRFRKSELPGDGYIFGNKDAPIHLIAFVDSQCPQCHRLIGYMRELVKDGKMFIELRQTAYLETAAEAVQDTQLHLTGKFNKTKSIVSDAEYVELLGGLNSDDAVDENSQAYKSALAMIEDNTRTARQVLHITSVPGVLVMDDKKNQAYRLASFWEMNRLFQPDL